MRIDELERELRAERPGPSPDFARRLDEWAEAGFPRDRRARTRPREARAALCCGSGSGSARRLRGGCCFRPGRSRQS